MTRSLIIASLIGLAVGCAYPTYHNLTPAFQHADTTATWFRHAADSLDRRDPVADARVAAANHDCHVYAFEGIALAVPGLRDWPHYKPGVQYFPGDAEMLRLEGQAEYHRAAAAYANRYNPAVLADSNCRAYAA